MASRSRRGPKEKKTNAEAREPEPMTADDVLDYVERHTNRGWLQLGGDATTGRGQVVVRIAGPGDKEK
jgi:CRISPR/Cas system CMR subunit Cmr4 (Cas7 group RAMP superfamily)